MSFDVPGIVRVLFHLLVSVFVVGLLLAGLFFVSLLVLVVRVFTFESGLDFEFRAGEDFSEEQRVDDALLGGGVEFTGVGVESGGGIGLVGHREEPTADQALADLDNLDLGLDDLGIEREVGKQAGGFGANAGDLEVVERGDETAQLVGVDFLGLVLEAIQLPLVGEVFARERVDCSVDSSPLLFVERVVVDGQVSDVVTGDFQQVGFDPVGKLRREVHFAFGDVDLILLGVADVVPIGGVFSTGDFGLVPDDVVGQCRAFGVLERDASPESLLVGVGLSRVEDTEFLVVGVLPHCTTFSQVAPLDAVERGGGLGQAILGIGRVVVVTRNHEQLGGGVLSNEKPAGLALALVEDDDFQRTGVRRVEVLEERLAELAVPVVGRSAVGADRSGQYDTDDRGGGETDGIAGFVVHGGVPGANGRSDVTVPELVRSGCDRRGCCWFRF